uniref:Uncharacterized protein n=1 Tax=Eutreptiella gymnastica TaxID=73025 RepID=A0A7S1IVV5_9EUGL
MNEPGVGRRPGRQPNAQRGQQFQLLYLARVSERPCLNRNLIKSKISMGLGVLTRLASQGVGTYMCKAFYMLFAMHMECSKLGLRLLVQQWSATAAQNAIVAG